jgi:hypothetical protein
MKRDPKKASTYRFNGNPLLHSDSIRTVNITDLETRIRELEAKLADPADPDDKKWTEGWLDRYKAELSKKLDGLSFKTEERAKFKSREHSRPRRETPDD